MKRWQRITLAALVGLVVVALGGLLWLTRDQALGIVHSPPEIRSLPSETPADYDLAYRDATVTSADGLRLVGWYIPGQNGAAVIAQHGYKANRGEMLNEAQWLHQAGYGVLISAVRAHDGSQGDLITFGHDEMQDMEAWYQYLLDQPEVDPERIGILGNSYGGMLAIDYAARNPQIKAVAANSAFSSLNDTVETSVTYFTGLPPFPFAPLIVFWAEQETGLRAADVDTKVWIRQLSPRPVFLMQGGRDVVISNLSGQRLYDAAGEPKELWYEPDLGHVEFDTAMPAEYERRVISFFDQYLQLP